MKEGWQTTTLGKACVLDKRQGLHKNLPYVGLEHIESQTGRFLGSTEPLEVRSSTFKFTPKHVLYGRLRPYLNKVMLPNFSGHCSTEIFPIRPLEVSREFLHYWFLTDTTVEQISATSTGTRMPRANMNTVLNFSFSFPSPPEQQRIVAILDVAFEGIATARANAERNLKNARAIFAAELDAAVQGKLTRDRDDGRLVASLIDSLAEARQAAVKQGKAKAEKAGKWDESHAEPFQIPISWRWVSLETLTVGISDGVHKKPSYIPSGIPFVTVKNLTAGTGISFDDLNYISRADHEEYIKRTHPERGDILISKDGTIGVVRAIETDVEFSIFVSVALVKPTTHNLTPYLVYALSAPCVQSQFVHKGTALKHLYLSDLRMLRIPLPPLATQTEIVVRLDGLLSEVTRLESVYQRKLDALDMLKHSLLHHAFSGHL